MPSETPTLVAPSLQPGELLAWPDLWRRACRALQTGEAAALVEVTETAGSVPRELGARMLVLDDDVVGTIGGGHLELQAITEARRCLLTGEALKRRYPLGPSLGQCCGGVVTLATKRLEAADLAAWPTRAARATIQIHGAGHVGQEIVRLLQRLPCHVTWVDERDDLVDGASAAHVVCAQIDQRWGDDPVSELRRAVAGTHVLILTHRHDLDFELCCAALQRDDLGWLGMIGSATKAARFRRQLRARGVSDDRVERLVCPIGLPAIAGKEPAVVALSVVAQLWTLVA